MRMIPGKTKVKMELFRGVRISDMLVAAVFLGLAVLVYTSNLTGGFYIILGLLAIAAILLARIGEDPNYVFLLHIVRHLVYKHHYAKQYSDELLVASYDEDALMELAMENVFSEKSGAQTKKERKAAEKERAAQRKEEDKLLKDDSVPQEEKDRILARRERESRASAQEETKQKEEKLERDGMGEVIPFTDIADNFISYNDEYYGAAIEITPVEFRFYSEYRRAIAIESGLGRVLRALPADYAANIVKIDRPVDYEPYLASDEQKMEELRRSFEAGFMTEQEFRARVEIMQDRLNMLRKLCTENRVVSPAYYLVLFGRNKEQLNRSVDSAMETLSGSNLPVRRLDSRGLALFLKYTNAIDFKEDDVDRIAQQDYAAWAMPETVDIKRRTVEVNRIITHNMMINSYPSSVGDGWLASLMSLPSTKVVVKCRPMDRIKAVRSIDRSLQELRTQYTATGVDSKRISLAGHIESLDMLLSMLQNDNETLLETNVYVTAYDIAATRADPHIIQPPRSLRRSFANQKDTVRQYYREENLKLKTMDFDQMKAFVGGQVSGFDTMADKAQSIPSNSLAACYPWIFASVSDLGGVPMGDFEGVPVFVDFFRRDSERVNSNMVIVGKTGSGKSYATKGLLANLAAEDAKIFVLDPENEYTELAENLHGKFINVGNAQQGRLNPFHIITALEDDEADNSGVSGSYASHLQFLEEFFRQILPDCDKDALEYLNSMVDRLYANMGITEETDLSRLSPEDYPTFNHLYEMILSNYQTTNNDYVRHMLRTLTTYISKFAGDGRNANIWNGPSTVTTAENFTVFNFQSLLANRNTTVANAQMLLVLKYIDNEIIKNREYNEKYGLHRKIVVVIDEAHVFIDNKFPAALDFMYQLAKRIRKYNGMQIVITQNIKDFVGSEDITRKSSAIINACQYSMIFSLAPNDMQDLCKLYEKAGGINEIEQDRISTAPRGHAFTIISPQSRSNISVKVPDATIRLFQERDCGSWYYAGEDGEARWEEFVGESRQLHSENMLSQEEEEQQMRAQTGGRKFVSFTEITEEELAEEMSRYLRLRGGAPEQKAPEVTPAAEVQQPAVQQPVVQPVIQPVVQQSEHAEELLEKLLDRVTSMNSFTYDSMVQEIRRSVRAEMETSRVGMETGRAAFAAPADEDVPDLSMVSLLADRLLNDDDTDDEEELFFDGLEGLFDDDDESGDEELNLDDVTPDDDDLVQLPALDDSEGSMSLGTIFNDDAMAEAARLREEEGDDLASLFDDDEDSDEELGELGISLSSLMNDTIDELEQENVIDLMPLYQDTVIEVSMEELFKYNKAHGF